MSEFRVYAAMDIKGGKVVRLLNGNLKNQPIVYSDNPLAMADQLVAGGVTRLNIIDLDGAGDAKGRAKRDFSLIAAIHQKHPGLRIYAGGGLRDMDSLRGAFNAGAAAVIVGTMALQNRPLLGEAVNRWPGRIIVDVPVRNGKVAYAGWNQTSDHSPVNYAINLPRGVNSILLTDISRDGTMEGPNLTLARVLGHRYGRVIVSGGIGGEDDIRNTAALADKGVIGAVLGRAYYEGKITLPQALKYVRA